MDKVARIKLEFQPLSAAASVIARAIQADKHGRRLHVRQGKGGGGLPQYRYTDMEGCWLCDVFAQGDAPGVPEIAGAPRVLYRLPAVMSALRAGDPIVFVGSEPVAERYAGLAVTTTCPGGFRAWRRADHGILAAAVAVELVATTGEERALAMDFGRRLFGMGVRDVRI